MNLLRKYGWSLVALTSIVCIVVYALQYIALVPWRMLPDIGGDGAKNNFTYLYHSMYGSGYWFTGMNFPFGEHIVFTDAVPLFSVFFATIGNVPAPVALTVLWWAVCLSYVLGMYYIFKLLRTYHVTPVMSIVFACLIGLLTPQMLRLRGHYALSFTAIIPMVFYWTSQYNTTGKLKYCVWIAIAGILHTFIHPYYAGLLLIWALAYGVASFLMSNERIGRRLRHVVPMLLSVALVASVVAIVMKVTDPITDRPPTPFIDQNTFTDVYQTTTSALSPITMWLNRHGLMEKVANGGEGFNYAGLVALITTLVWIPVAVLLYIRRHKNGTNDTKPEMLLWIVMALGILAFSMGIPFVWNMSLMDHLSVFKQFRSLGRFSWLYYYLITISAAVILFRFANWLQARSGKLIGYGFLGLCVAVWGLEARGYVTYARETSQNGAYNFDFTFSKFEQNWHDFLQEHHYKNTDFQAVISLPYYHIGSEKLWIGEPGWSHSQTTKCGLQLHLPIIDVMLSRTSLHQTRELAKTCAGPYVDKPLLHMLPDNRPMLLLHFQSDSLDPDQKWLLSAASLIGQHSEFNVYALSATKLLQLEAAKTAEIDALLPALATNRELLTGADGTLFTEHFDGLPASGLGGKGACSYMPPADTTLLTIHRTTKESDSVEFSCWFNLAGGNPIAPLIKLQFRDSGNNLLGQIAVEPKQSVDSYRDWYRASRYFRVPQGCTTISCQLFRMGVNTYSAIDEVLLRPASSVVISRTPDGSIMVNNHLFRHK